MLPIPPLVSILINNYNYGRFLEKAIESALCQTYENLEVIVVDDGSTDGSREIIASYGDRIIPVLKENGGQATAFNAGFERSSGGIVCFLDADDLFAAEKVEKVYQTFERHPEIGWCFDRVRQFNDVTGEQNPLASEWKVGAVDFRRDMAAGTPPNIPTSTSGISMRRNLLARILPMPEMIRITSDGYIKLSAISLAPGWRMAEEITLQRIHGSNLYTGLKAGRKRLVSKTGLLTGICLWERFPDLERVGTKLFSRNFGMCWMSGGFESECRDLTRTFWARLPVRSKTEVMLKVAYWSARDLVLG
jgi:glycosyltransferase involved in cell wall biosynthesis